MVNSQMEYFTALNNNIIEVVKCLRYFTREKTVHFELIFIKIYDINYNKNKPTKHIKKSPTDIRCRFVLSCVLIL